MLCCHVVDSSVWPARASQHCLTHVVHTGVWGGLGLTADSSTSTVALALINSTIVGNTASHGGSQVYSTGVADVLLSDVVVGMDCANTQVTSGVGMGCVYHSVCPGHVRGMSVACV
jgi:hypothetical protein